MNFRVVRCGAVALLTRVSIMVISFVSLSDQACKLLHLTTDVPKPKACKTLDSYVPAVMCLPGFFGTSFRGIRFENATLNLVKRHAGRMNISFGKLVT